MQIYDFVKKELDMLREECNFTESEMEYFNLRSTGMSNVQIAMAMCVSEAQVSKLARRVKDKIKRVL